MMGPPVTLIGAFYQSVTAARFTGISPGKKETDVVEAQHVCRIKDPEETARYVINDM